MSCLREYILKLESTDGKKKVVEPPMNTDEHRLKADKEQKDKNRIAFVFIKSLSVFIGVHRWLKIIGFSLLNRDSSVGASLGVCDAFVA